MNWELPQPIFLTANLTLMKTVLFQQTGLVNWLTNKLFFKIPKIESLHFMQIYFSLDVQRNSCREIFLLWLWQAVRRDMQISHFWHSLTWMPHPHLSPTFFGCDPSDLICADQWDADKWKRIRWRRWHRRARGRRFWSQPSAWNNKRFTCCR